MDFRQGQTQRRSKKCSPVIRLLIEHGASVQTATPRESVLHLAIATGNVKIVRLVLDAGAPLEGDGVDALMLAQPYPKITALLRRRGGVGKRSRSRWTAASRSSRRGWVR